MDKKVMPLAVKFGTLNQKSIGNIKKKILKINK